jgi:hypothetical protein
MTFSVVGKAMVKLASLQYKSQYMIGPGNKVADALSRVGHSFFIQSTSVPIWIHEVLNSYAVDSAAQKLLQELAVVSPNS